MEIPESCSHQVWTARVRDLLGVPEAKEVYVVANLEGLISQGYLRPEDADEYQYLMRVGYQRGWVSVSEYKAP